MLDRLFATIKLPLSLKQFHQIPQNPAFKYEYIDGVAWLSPRPKFYSARLDLRVHSLVVPETVDVDGEVEFRKFGEADWRFLAPIFAASFDRVQPFASLSDRRRQAAARDCLEFTREGNDGPLITSACHVAFDRGGKGEREQLLGALLVTLIPMVDLSDFWSLRWKTPPPPDCIERGLGRPHLTWIFVAPMFAGHGIGSALLAYASQSLLTLGYTELISSFLLGNTSSMLWHWRNGFDLLPYVGSIRNLKARRTKPPKAEGELAS
jgi:GNAT superfamily N-acetyltransferase